MAADLPTPPRTETFSVTEVVGDALRGRLRIPPFQRPIKWTIDDVALLFDSLLRGYPVGSLLLWRGGPPVPDGPLQLGPVVVERPGREEVRWIVDGQQRVVSLTAALTPMGARDPRFAIWFDPDDARFVKCGRRGPDRHWVEVWRLLDAADLGEYLLDWAPGTPERRRAILEAGKRIREARIPATTMEADDRVVRLVFQRLNNQGKALEPSEIFDGWAAPGGTLKELSAAVEQLGWGALDEDVLLSAVLVNEQRNPTQRLTPEDQVELLARATDRVRSGLLRTIEFLRTDAVIPHLRLLPYNTPLQVLPALFCRHPEPSARSRHLLVRWVWRILASSRPTDPVVRRAAARVAQADGGLEEERVQALLATAAHDIQPWSFDAHRFRSDSGSGRMGLLALADLAPLGLYSGLPVDLGRLLDSGSEIASIVTSGARQGTLRETIANRILHVPRNDLEQAIRSRIAEVGPDSDELQSHAINPEAALALQGGDSERFLELRADTIERLVNAQSKRLTAWDQDDRPALRELFAK
ncbi:MAG: DUF262 domain-containing protein [Myxococcota bacterium]